MEEKDKAKELVEKFFTETGDSEFNKHCARENALICVDEMLSEYELIAPNYQRVKFWKEVKAELNKL